jgi:hypothetical protein
LHGTFIRDAVPRYGGVALGCHASAQFAVRGHLRNEPALLF